MKTVLRYVMILAVCLIPFMFIDIKERFPVMFGITVGVTVAFWVSNAIIEKKRKKAYDKEQRKKDKLD